MPKKSDIETGRRRWRCGGVARDAATRGALRFRLALLPCLLSLVSCPHRLFASPFLSLLLSRAIRSENLSIDSSQIGCNSSKLHQEHRASKV